MAWAIISWSWRIFPAPAEVVPRALGLTLQRFDLSPRHSGVGPNAQTNTHSAMYFPRVRGGLAEQ